MDDLQSDHLKAYGVAYRVVQAGLRAEWLLNYRGGSFLVSSTSSTPARPGSARWCASTAPRRDSSASRAFLS